jgi:hypothetical protein
LQPDLKQKFELFCGEEINVLLGFVVRITFGEGDEGPRLKPEVRSTHDKRTKGGRLGRKKRCGIGATSRGLLPSFFFKRVGSLFLGRSRFLMRALAACAPRVGSACV